MTVLTTLTPDAESANHLLLAAMKSRSIAEEGGYGSLLSLPEMPQYALDRWLGDDRTIDLLADLSSGKREFSPGLWLNIAHMVETSASWQMSLSVREVRMPTKAEILSASLGVEIND